MNKDASSIVLYEVIRRAMDEAIELKKKEPLNEWDSGSLFAYFNIIDWGKQQAEVWDVHFGDKELESFDPYSLLDGRKA